MPLVMKEKDPQNVKRSTVDSVSSGGSETGSDEYSADGKPPEQISVSVEGPKSPNGDRPSSSCQCRTNGFCELRNCEVNKLLWKQCQLGHVEAVTKLLQGAVTAKPKVTNRLTKEVSSVGTEIRRIFEDTEQVSITCGECLRYLTKLNLTTVHSHSSIVTYLSANAPFKTKLKYRDRVSYVSNMISHIVPINTPSVPTPVNPVGLVNHGDWATIVTTAPRQNPTVSQCLASLSACGWSPVVFAEPDSIITDGYAHYCNKVKLGAWHNWLQSVKWALTRTTAKYILSVQDDSLFHPDSKYLVEQIMWPNHNVGFVSLYTAKHYSADRSGNLKPFGVNKLQINSLWGACALVFPRHVLQEILTHPVAIDWTGIPDNKLTSRERANLLEKKRLEPSLIQNVDTAIGRILNSIGLDMFFIDPSPVSHISTFSSIGHSNNNHGKRNCGRCADHNTPLLPQVFPA